MQASGPPSQRVVMNRDLIAGGAMSSAKGALASGRVFQPCRGGSFRLGSHSACIAGAQAHRGCGHAGQPADRVQALGAQARKGVPRRRGAVCAAVRSVAGQLAVCARVQRAARLALGAPSLPSHGHAQAVQRMDAWPKCRSMLALARPSLSACLHKATTLFLAARAACSVAALAACCIAAAVRAAAHARAQHAWQHCWHVHRAPSHTLRKP